MYILYCTVYCMSCPTHAYSLQPPCKYFPQLRLWKENKNTVCLRHFTISYPLIILLHCYCTPSTPLIGCQFCSNQGRLSKEFTPKICIYSTQLRRHLPFPQCFAKIGLSAELGTRDNCSDNLTLPNNCGTLPLNMYVLCCIWKHILYFSVSQST